LAVLPSAFTILYDGSALATSILEVLGSLDGDLGCLLGPIKEAVAAVLAFLALDEVSDSSLDWNEDGVLSSSKTNLTFYVEGNVVTPCRLAASSTYSSAAISV